MPSGPEELDEFNLFCAYHMGITRGNGYKFQSLKEVAARFDTTLQILKRKLIEFGLETERLREVGFEAEFYQLDIKVAPEGVSRRELARTMWDELVELRGPAPGPSALPPLEEDEAPQTAVSEPEPQPEASPAEAEEEAEASPPVEAPVVEEAEAPAADEVAAAEETEEPDELPEAVSAA